jgi:hypothetical protein
MTMIPHDTHLYIGSLLFEGICRATIKVREPDNQDERVFRGLC